MTKILINVLSMSASASFVALIVMLLRVPLRKAPKIFSYALWAVVFFRLICPFQFESPISLMPQGPAMSPAVLTDYMPSQTGAVNTAPKEPAVKPETAAVLKEEAASDIIKATGLNAYTIVAAIWLSGLGLLVLHEAYVYIRIKRRVFDATVVEGNIYESDKIPTAFVMGFITPRIYLPVSADDARRTFILEHEQVHIRRRDYLIKPAAFLIAAIHWFNPIVWVSYYLMSMDMEMSCDEAVLRRTNDDIRKVYSASLVNLYTYKLDLLSPIAFGEGSFKTMKMRVSNVLKFKKTPKWVVVICSAMLIIVTAGFMTKPQATGEKTNDNFAVSNQSGDVNSNLTAESTVKDITIEIEKIVKNDNMVKVYYIIQDAQNRFSQYMYDGSIEAHFKAKGLDNDSYSSQAFKGEDGKYYGTLDIFSLDGLEPLDNQLEIEMTSVIHQINAQGKKIDLEGLNLNTPTLLTMTTKLEDEWKEIKEDLGDGSKDMDYYETFRFLQPDVYSEKLPAETGEGDVWLSNIGIVNNELRIQIKAPALTDSSADGVYATDTYIYMQSQGVDPEYLSRVGEFYISESDEISFLDFKTAAYIVTEFAMDLGQQPLEQLEFYCSPIFQSIINGSWMVSHATENLTQSITRDLTGLKIPNVGSPVVIPVEANGVVMLKSLTMTPLYYEITFEPEVKPYNFAFFPTVVITYTDGSKMELTGFQAISGDANSDIHRGVRFIEHSYELIEIDEITSITIDGTQVFNLNQ